MRIPLSVMARLRGPALAVAVVGCSSPSITPEPTEAPEPDPVSAVAALDPNATSPDAVAYDATSEDERLSRLEGVATRDDGRRARRIDDEEDARRRARENRLGLSAIGGGTQDHHLWACGRG